MIDADGDCPSHALSPSDVRQLRWELGIISEEDLAAVLDSTIRALRDWRNKRWGPPWLKAGKTVFYRRASVMAWLERLEECGSAEEPRR